MKRILVVLMFVPVLLSAQNSQKNVTVLTEAHQSTMTGNSQQLVVQNIALKTGVRLQYVEQGSKAGVPVIFLHGLGAARYFVKPVTYGRILDGLRFLVNNQQQGNLVRQSFNDFVIDMGPLSQLS